MRFNKLFLILAFTLTLSVLVGYNTLNSGWTHEDAGRFIQANLDSLYLNKHDDVIELSETTEEEAIEAYYTGVDIEADFFANYFEIDLELLPEAKEEIVSFLDKVYSYSNYEITETNNIGKDNFLVKVSVKPIDVIVQIINDIDAIVSKYEAALTENVSMSEKELETLWVDLILECGYKKLPTVQYLEEIEHLVEIFLDENGYYTTTDSFYNIDEDIIAY